MKRSDFFKIAGKASGLSSIAIGAVIKAKGFIYSDLNKTDPGEKTTYVNSGKDSNLRAGFLEANSVSCVPCADVYSLLLSVRLIHPRFDTLFTFLRPCS